MAQASKQSSKMRTQNLLKLMTWKSVVTLATSWGSNYSGIVGGEAWLEWIKEWMKRKYRIY